MGYLPLSYIFTLIAPVSFAIFSLLFFFSSYLSLFLSSNSLFISPSLPCSISLILFISLSVSLFHRPSFSLSISFSLFFFLLCTSLITLCITLFPISASICTYTASEHMFAFATSPHHPHASRYRVVGDCQRVGRIFESAR